ncbi:MAG TPA: S41 family peptidase [Vicinamibacterales bacterium]|nr:S41 family peptidase [Vicinamibacterales bacterium]
MSFKTRMSVLLLSTPVLAFVLVGGLIGKEPPSAEQTYQHLRVFQDVVDLVTHNYVGEVQVDKVMDGAMRGLADGLDPDSAFLNAGQVKAVESGEALPDGDIGIELTRRYYLYVIAARDGSAADKAGLRTADTIRAIDGKPTRDMSVFEGTRLLRGKPGTKVTLTIIRGNAADPHEVVLTREKLAGPVVTSRMIGTAGYLRIASFRDGVVDEVRKQAGELAKNGAKALIVDIRRTAEGPLENGIAAARPFVKTGTLAIKAGRGKPEPREPVAARTGDGAIDLPVTVLIATGTSGPAELFAAALQDNKRAESIGERTLGRAGIQKLVKLPEGRGLWLTYARYLTPAGSPIQGRGIEPSVVVEEPDVEFGAPAPKTDPILDTAIERVKIRAAA